MGEGPEVVEMAGEDQLKARLLRTVLALAAVVVATLAVRWTIRTAVERRYAPPRREPSAEEMPFVPAPRVWSLARIVPKELRTSIAGVEVPRTKERLHMPYSLAVDVADDRAASMGWERLDPENALTLRNLAGMNRVYRRPDGVMVLRTLLPGRGDETLVEDIEFPAAFAQPPDAPVLPEEMARRMEAGMKTLLPDPIRDVVVGNPLMTDLVERGEGAALLVHTLADLPTNAAAAEIAAAARRTGWTDARPADPAFRGRPDRFPVRYTKQNLSFDFKITPREDGAGCNVSYRFTDDEVLVPNKRSNQ